jgi:hypothetical protein
MVSLPYTGRLLNAIILLVVTLSAFGLSRSILKLHPDDKKNRYFGYFWLATAFLWLSSTLRNIFAAFGALGVDFFLFHFTQTFVYISGIFLGPYLAMKILKNDRAVWWVTISYRIIAFAGIILLFAYGVRRGATDEYSTDYIPNIYADTVFTVAIIPLLIISIIDMIMHAARYITGKEQLFYETLASLSIAIYLLVGVIDERGFLGSWELNLFRLVFVASFFMAYAATLQEATAKEKQNPTTTFEI